MDEGEGFLAVKSLRRDGAQAADAMDALRTGVLDAVVVQGLFTPLECARMVAELEANIAGFEVTEFPGPFKSFFYGRNLNLNSPELTDYFAAAAQFERALGKFTDDVGVDVCNRITQLLGELDAGRPFLPAPGPDEQTHFFTTFRGHRPGGYIPAHFDNEQRFRPSYTYVAAQTSGSILSFVVTLSEAELGGMVEFFDMKAEDLATSVRNDDAASKPDLSSMRSQRLHVPAGGIAIVNSGARLHRVVPVEGSKTRWTICSFMAEARDGMCTYCWG